MKKERRRTRRYPIDAAIEVNENMSLGIDLSHGGVFVESPRPFEAGELVVLTLPHEHGGPAASVSCTARVVRVEPRGHFYGIAAVYEPVAGFFDPNALVQSRT